MPNPFTDRIAQLLGIVNVQADSQTPLPVATSTKQRIAEVTIPSGEAVSSLITLAPGERIVGIIMPGAWTTANLVALVSADNSTFQYAISYGTAIQMFPVADRTTLMDAIDADKISRLPYVKLVSATASGSTVTAVNQAAERVLQVIVVSQ